MSINFEVLPHDIYFSISDFSVSCKRPPQIIIPKELSLQSSRTKRYVWCVLFKLCFWTHV